MREFTFALPALLFYSLANIYLSICKSTFMFRVPIAYPFAISQVFSILVSIVAHYLLMFVADLGILGAGYALGIS